MLEANTNAMDLNIEAQALSLLRRATFWGYGFAALMTLGAPALLFAALRAPL